MHLSSARLATIILDGYLMTTRHLKKPVQKKPQRTISMHFQWYLAAVATLVTQLSLAGPVTAVDALVTAAAGQPYGVATIEFPVEAPVIGKVFPPVRASDEAGRVLFPISDDLRVNVDRVSERPVPQPGRGRLLNRVGGLIRELTDKDQVLEQTVARRVSFLFIGSQPLSIRIADANGEIGTYQIIPSNDAVEHAEVLGQWWSRYTDAARRQIEAADYPAWVETYLVAMLSGRIGLPLPDWYTDTEAKDDELLNTLKLIAGARGADEAAFRRAAAGFDSQSPVSLPLPAPPVWAPMFAQPSLADVPVEPMASRVPAECFYIRYGSFENFLWFRDLSAEHGGDISEMITLRGIENDAAARVEKQLNLQTTNLSRMLGPTVIDDQAIIGRDLFLADGATIGILFKAKNAFLLRTSLNGDRSSLASDDDTVTLKDIKIDGRVVSLLSSGDNQVRSFLAEDGEYILVANSRTLVERFLEVAKTGESLATTPAFQLSRQLMPLERGDTIFAYFSPAMLRGLVSPEYLIELRRRLHAKSDVALVHLARLAAAQQAAEQQDADDGIDPLSAAGFLPRGFGQRPDGSGVVAVGDQVIDTLRGARGTFIPIADVKIDAVTAEESAWYSEIAKQYSLRFPTIDPIMVGIQREAVDQKTGIERITIHAEIAPWEAGKYGKIAQQLGPPTRVAMQFAPDDIVAVQAHVASPQLGPPTHLFAAIKDTVPPKPEDFDGIINIYRSLRQVPGYLGAWPQPGAIDRLPLGLGLGQPIGPGMSRLIGGVYRYTDGQFSILSFQPDVMQASLPFLAAIDADDAAQVRVRIGNLYGSRIEGWVNGQLYERARESSIAGANFLSLLSRQLKVEPEFVLSSAQQILGTQLQCTLGGEYQFSPASERWISTAWQGETASQIAPPDYVAPAMNWFRGANASLTQHADRLVADAVIDIARQ